MATPLNPGAADGLPKVEATSAQEVTVLYEPSEAAVQLSDADTTPARFVDLLFDAELFDDAIMFLAYALPKREAVWWGIACARDVAPDDLPEEGVAALQAAEAWLSDPTDENRRNSFEAAKAATYDTPPGCIALAVFFSEGSLSPADCPPVPVGEGFCARTTAAAILLSSLQVAPDDVAAKAKAFALSGIEAARSIAPWDEK